MKVKYFVVVEKGEHNYSAFAPDVPGCASTGKTIEETLNNFREALEFHLEGTVQDGDPVPDVYAVHAEFVEVDRPATVTAAS